MNKYSKLMKFSIFTVLLGSEVFCGRLKFFQNANANIDEAITLCNNEGMDLVTIEDATEHQRIRDFLDCMGSSSALNTDIWIGLYYDEDTEAFYWMSDGSQTTYTDWLPSSCSGGWGCDPEPNNLPPDGDEGNVRLSVGSSNYYFMSREGSKTFDVLCEENGQNPSYLGCPVTTSTTSPTTTTSITTTATPTTTTTTPTTTSTTPTTTTTTPTTTTTTPTTTTPTTTTTTPTTTTTTPTTTTTTTPTTTTTTPTTTTSPTTTSTSTTPTTITIPTTITTPTTTTTTTTSTTTETTTTTEPSTTTTIPTTTTPTTAALTTSITTTIIGTALGSTTSKNSDRIWEIIGWTLGGTAAFALVIAAACYLRRFIGARQRHYKGRKENVTNVKDRYRGQENSGKDRDGPASRGHRTSSRTKGQIQHPLHVKDSFDGSGWSLNLSRSSELTSVESMHSGSASIAAESPILGRMFRNSGPNKVSPSVVVQRSSSFLSKQ